MNFRNTSYYPSFVAASFDKVSAFARANAWNLKLLSWAFLFVGERCFEGTRAFSTQGIDKAILNLFRMYGMLGSRLLGFSSTGAQNPLAYADAWGMAEPADVAGFAASDAQGLAALIYHHHDNWDAQADATIELTFTNLPFAAAEVRHYRIDPTQSNAYAEWLRQGKPSYPTPEQRAALLEHAGLELLEPARSIPADNGSLRLTFTLPVHGISLVQLRRA